MKSNIEHLEHIEYTRPQVIDYGDLRDLTAGTQGGNYTDAAFPSGTPRGDLTFSVSP